MERKVTLGTVVALALALSAADGFAAQGKGGGGPGASGDRAQQMGRDRTMDHAPAWDRMQSRDRLDSPRQDRDRIHADDPASIRDQDIYGHELMSGAELNAYRARLGQFNTEATRAEFRTTHEAAMQERALRQGVDLVPPGQGAVYGGQLMTVQERNEFREQLRNCDSDAERQELLAQHRQRIEERARALGVAIDESE